ncbi:hypothetical protein [Parvibaculum sp.]|uniref:hypothetical protein n=1 Tax=Parvibaculum sp. TaxID=2024848 RepID=UPI0034A04F08
MMDLLRQPAEWRPADWQEQAATYRDQAERVRDIGLRRQFAELAHRHLEMAEILEKTG